MDTDSLSIYRITHISNLRLFLETDCLFAPNSVPQRYLGKYRNICNLEIQEARGNIYVPDMQGATVHDFVPFYFCPKSPMLYSVTYSKKAQNDEIIYLVADAYAIARSNHQFCFTDCNARLRYAIWYKDLTDIEQLDWKAINAQYWGTNTDPTSYTKQHKMAEFLVYGTLEWKFINKIAVFSDKSRELATSIMKDFPVSQHKDIAVMANWYY